VVASNIGTLVVGERFSGYDSVAAQNTVIEAHDGSITKRREAGTTVSNTTNRTVLEPVKLSRSEVGPLAPTAPRMYANTAMF